MFPNSMRWRLLSWFAFLLFCVLAGFGVTVYQLQRVHQFKQIDDQLQRRITVLSDAVRTLQPPPGGGPPPLGEPPGGGPSRSSDRPPPPDRPGPGTPGEASHNNRPPPRNPPRPAELTSLFNENQPNGYYYVMWSRDQSVLSSSTNAPTVTPLPDRVAFDTETHLRQRGTYRDAYHF